MSFTWYRYCTFLAFTLVQVGKKYIHDQRNLQPSLLNSIMIDSTSSRMTRKAKTNDAAKLYLPSYSFITAGIVCFIAMGVHIFSFNTPAPNELVEQLVPIDRIREQDLDEHTFLTRYVMTGTPVIILRKDADSSNSKDMISSLVNNCGDLSVPGIPPPVRIFLNSLSPWQFQLAKLLMKIFIGVDLEKWIAVRERIRIADIHEVARSETSLKVDISKLLYVFPSFVPRILEILSRPLYLGDALVTYSNMRDKCGLDIHVTKQEKHAQSKRPLQQDEIWLFWGGIDSAYYPLHRDHNEKDVMVDVISGCKDFVVVHPEERHKLNKIPFPGSDIWDNDFFPLSTTTALEQIGLKKAWKGTISSGETLFMAGDSLHEARNNCPTTVSLSRRPWLEKTFRDVQFTDAHASVY